MGARDFNAMMKDPVARSYYMKQQIEMHKKYCKDNPDSLMPFFSQELWYLGFDFEIPEQALRYLPKNKKSILPVAIKYYQLAKGNGKDNEQDFFLGFFRFKGFDEVLPMLLEDYYDDKTTDLTRWFISDTIYTIRSKKYINEYIKMISNPRFGRNRQLIVLLLGRFKEESAIPVLIQLLEDEDVRLHAISALGDFKREEYRPCFERFKDSKHPGWRKYARAAIKKLDTQAARQGQE